MVDKLLLTALLGFLPSDWQCAFGMLVCVVFIIIVLCTDPYARAMDDRMCLLVQTHLLLILLVGRVMRYNRLVAGSTEDVLASLVLFVVLGILVALLIYNAVIFVRCAPSPAFFGVVCAE